MRYLLILFFLSSCSLQRMNALAEQCCDRPYTDLQKGRVSSYAKDKSLFVMVFDEGDQASFDQPLLETLNFTEQKDRLYLKILKEDFVLVKIFRSELDQYLEKEEEGYCRSFVESYSYGSFAFISSPEVFCVYAPTKFTNKEGLEDLLWVKFGP